MPYSDPEKRKQYQKEYQLKNKDKLTIQRKEYFEKNKDKLKLARELRPKSPDKRRQTPEGIERERERYRKYEKQRRKKPEEYQQKRRSQCREYHQKNKEVQNKKTREYQATNRDVIKIKKREQYLKDREQRLVYAAEYRDKNRHRFHEWRKQWAKNNPDRLRELNNSRRARKRAAICGDISIIESWNKYWRPLESVSCYWCGKRFPGKDCHADHVVPLSKGGMHRIENLVISCKKCNLQKNDMMPSDWEFRLKKNR